MKHKTWFRLVIKAIGVLMLGLSIPQVGGQLGQMLFYMSSGMLGSGSELWMYSMWLVGALLQLGLGIYLFFGGAWIVNKCIPSNRPYCPECGYDLSHSRGEKCAECGVVLPTQAPND